MTIAWRRFDTVPTDQRNFGEISNDRRTERRRKALHERVTNLRGTPRQDDLPHIAATRTALDPRVAAALDRLSVEDREVLLLHEWDECSYAEIAVSLGSTEPAARKRVSRARKRFAMHYGSSDLIGDDYAN
jgi:RNA polymerase sigma factor (sigma-70 family)